ncbi:hypothetical protein MTO96_032834, partial [Rhipicephalus appendiculatus]
MALDAATNQQYHHLKQDGTTDDPMEHVQDDDDTEIQLANRDLSHRNLKSSKYKRATVIGSTRDNANDPPRTKTLRWFSSKEEDDAYKLADDKQCSQSHAQSPGRNPCSSPKKSAPASRRENLHHSPPGGGAKSNDGDQGHTQQASSLP